MNMRWWLQLKDNTPFSTLTTYEGTKQLGVHREKSCILLSGKHGEAFIKADCKSHIYATSGDKNPFLT